ncbi:MAG TPA: matrixin family metalloprotease [Polyangiaceae bacterium]|jgi:MYXO-CTERM domain-containing protein
MVPAVQPVTPAIADVREMPGPNLRGGRSWAIALGGKRPTTAWNPVFPQGTWPAASLPVALYIAQPKSRDLGDDEDAEVEVAARAWNRLPCTAFRARVAGVTQTPPGDDTTSGVYFEDATWPSDFTPGAIATTVVRVDAQGEIYDADIFVNGADHVFSVDGRDGTIDFRSIATHEIGHVLGLGESNDPIATMYAAYPPGVAWRSLEQDDEDGACTLYPGVGDLAGCQDSACPSPFLCVARECERPGDQRMLCSPCEANTTSGCEGAGAKARCVALQNGYACGRPCASNDDCGLGFSCEATTESGDYQCIAQDDCATAANPCATVAQCNDPGDAGWICSSAACVGALPPEAGADASADAGDVEIGAPRGGCSCEAGKPGGSPSVLALAFGLLLGVRRKRAWFSV